VPAQLHDDYATDVPSDPGGLPGFLDQVATIVHRTPDQARYLAQAVLSVMREQDDELMASLQLPEYVRELLVPPAEGGVVGVDGRTPPLTDDELRAALAGLPRWSGDRRGLVRTIVLPPGNLERVLRRLADLKREAGRGPHIGRPDEGVAMLVVRTSRVNAVTALDVELAHRVDTAIEEAGAGMDAG
jgi:pterin-4a-carbinolamine dehydratase